MTQYNIPTYKRQLCPRYKLNEEDAVECIIDILEHEVKTDDPSDDELQKAVIDGIERSIKELKEYLLDVKDKLAEEVREIFDECLEEE